MVAWIRLAANATSNRRDGTCVQVVRSDPARLNVLRHLKSRRREVAVDLDVEVELAHALIPIDTLPLPVLDVQKLRRAAQLPAGLFADLASERGEQILPLIDVATDDVPAIRQEGTVGPAPVHEHTAARVADQSTDRADASVGHGTALQGGEVGSGRKLTVRHRA